jgi:hypothetical protein
MPDLSDPTARYQLAPGNYFVRAEKSVSGALRQTSPVPVQVFGQDRISADIRAR